MVRPNGPLPDSDVVLSTLRQRSEAEIAFVAVYGATSFDVFYVGDAIREAFDDRDDFRSYISGLAQKARDEFVERGLFAGLRPVGDRIEFRVDEHDGLQFVHVFCGGRGMLLAVDPDEPVKPLVSVAAGLLSGSL